MIESGWWQVSHRRSASFSNWVAWSVRLRSFGLWQIVQSISGALGWKNRDSSGSATSWVPWQVQHFGPISSSACRLYWNSAWVAVWHLPQTSTTFALVGGWASCEPWQDAHVGARMSAFSRSWMPWMLFW